MHMSPRRSAGSAAVRYLSCLRPLEILILQGSPLLGAAFAFPHLGAEHVRPLALLVATSICLVAYVFLINDWSGLTSDLTNPNRAASVFTNRGVSHKEMVGLTRLMLALSLLLSGGLGPIALALTLAVASLGTLYSLPRFGWKGQPILNSAAHLAGGAFHFLLGYSIGSSIDSRGLTMAIYFGVIFTAGHLVQEIRDHEADASHGIRTNAVIFGTRRTFLASLVLFTASHALLLFLALRGVVPRPLASLVVLYPLQLFWSITALTDDLTYASICRLQMRYRALYAFVGLAMMAALYGTAVK